MSNFAFLIGIFGVPVAALWLGHQFRDRTPRQRSIFWGMVIGYAVGLTAVSLALMAKPVLWTDAEPMRSAMVYWGLLASALLGAAVGLLRRVPSSE